MIEIDEIKTGKRLNQTCTLQPARDTRWSSHLRSISNLIKNLVQLVKLLLNSLIWELLLSNEQKQIKFIR